MTLKLKVKALPLSRDAEAAETQGTERITRNTSNRGKITETMVLSFSFFFRSLSIKMNNICRMIKPPQMTASQNMLRLKSLHLNHDPKISYNNWKYTCQQSTKTYPWESFDSVIYSASGIIFWLCLNKLPSENLKKRKLDRWGVWHCIYLCDNEIIIIRETVVWLWNDAYIIR